MDGGAPPGQIDARGWRSVLRIVGLGAVIGAIAAVWALAFRYQRGAPPPSVADVVFTFVAPAAYLVPGVVVLLRRQWHVVGWLLCLSGATTTLTLSGSWAPVALREGDAWVVLLAQTLGEGALGWLPLVALFLVFPDGFAAQTARQRWVNRGVLAVAVAAAVAELFVRQVGLSGVPGLLPNPLPFAVVPRSVLSTTGTIEILALAVAFVGLVVRHRSARAAARRQYRWVLLAVGLMVAGLAFGLAMSTVAADDAGTWWVPLVLSFVFLPTAFMVAILRYRLYEIDRVISRTVGYALVVALLGAIYAAGVTLLTALLPSGNDLAVAASTLGAAAAFAPLRRTVQRAVDRRFNRPRFDADREVERFTRSLRDQTDMAVIESELTGAIEGVLRPRTVLLWIPRRGLGADP
jgi:hypothetical protein